MSFLTPRDIKKPISELDLNSIPVWPDGLVEEAFFRVRDERWLDAAESPGIKRRIPWFYVDNGCFLRASLIRRKLFEWGYPPIKKIFCFGDMKFRSQWSLSGEMTYKDHVAVILRDSEGCKVFDPSLYFDAPLKLEEWIFRLHDNKQESGATFSICSDLTFGHNSRYDETDPTKEKGSRNGEMQPVEFFASEFLCKEWQRVQSLNQDPVKTLG
jgi:hypothetical protein